MPLLADELAKLENWEAVLPPASSLLVVAAQAAEADRATLVLHPLGALRVSQRAVPLDLTIDKVGDQKPSDANRSRSSRRRRAGRSAPTPTSSSPRRSSRT